MAFRDSVSMHCIWRNMLCIFRPQGMCIGIDWYLDHMELHDDDSSEQVPSDIMILSQLLLAFAFVGCLPVCS